MTDGSELILYHAAPSRSSIVHWMLEEVGHPYELRVLDIKKQENRTPGYLAVNPMGKVPTLLHDGAVITESAAICCHLADAFPESRLNFPVRDPRRGPYLKWLFFGPSCIEPAMIDRMMQRQTGPRSAVGYGDYDTTMGVVADALRQGPYLFGKTFTAADVVIGSTLRWGMLFDLIPDRVEFKAYVERLVERPAFKRSQATDAELAPPAAG